MFATLVQLEVLVLEDMNRDQLIVALLAYRDALELDLPQQLLDRQSTDTLRLFMLAAKLLRALRASQRWPVATGGNRLDRNG
jgi:hypothetical protein